MAMQQYLERYAEHDTSLSEAIEGSWQQVICIPAYDEAERLPQLLERLNKQAGLLLILVLNSPDTATGTAADLATQQLASTLRKQFESVLNIDASSSLLKLNELASHILLLERYELPANQGVGLARKIACDLACQLIADQKIVSQCIHSTDADVHLPEDYFSVVCDDNAAAAIYPFRHEQNPDSLFERSLELYELSLHYYVAGLQWAGSPYAFHTIGSTLLINSRHYALARGFPKRAGGEDFYLLNKLAKTGPIRQLLSTPLVLSGRNSDRAPFGTGQAVNKISQLIKTSEAYRYYHPQSFVLLKQWLQVIPSLKDADDHEQLVDNDLLLECLNKMQAGKALVHARSHSKNHDNFMRHMHNWFDAFRTLKLIHCLRDAGLKPVTLEELQAQQEAFEFIRKALQFKPVLNS